MRRHLSWLVVLGVIAALFAVSVIIRLGQYKEHISVTDLDASYHVVTTVQAMQANGLRVSKLLPIVSYAGPNDKNVPWAGAVADKAGNLIYTSFPQGAFVAPYLFFTATGVEPSIKSLMGFNFGINFITAALLLALVFLIARDVGVSIRHSQLLSLTVSASYVFSIEALYSQGIVYWAQSLYQAVLIAQLILLRSIIKRKRVTTALGLLLAATCAAAPLLEWTGLLGNFGILVFWVATYFRTRQKHTLAAGLLVIAGTLLGLLMFIGPMIYALGADTFMKSLQARFLPRSAGSAAPWRSLLDGYAESFGPILYATLILALVAMLSITTRLRFLSNVQLLFGYLMIVLFAMLENVILKQHAIAYTFDRLKLFLLLAILLVCIYSAFGRRMRHVFYIVAAACLSVNVLLFHNDSSAVAYNPSLESNSEMTAPIKDNMIVASDGAVRGFVSSSLERGVYEFIRDASQLRAIAAKRRVDSAVWLRGESLGNAVYQWNTTVSYGFKRNTALIKFRNNRCSQAFYILKRDLVPETLEVSRIYNPSTNQDVEVLGSAAVEKIRAEKSEHKHGDCFDSVMIELRPR